MISLLQGTVASQKSDHVVLLVGGVGFKVTVPVNVAATAGESLTLHTVMIVREDLIALYGFETPEEREVFERLISVNGVGPRIGVAVIGTLGIDRLRTAVSTGQVDVLSRVPGVGRKTGEKIILELRDKLKGADGLIAAGPLSEVNRDLLDALAGLGYTPSEAQSALNSIPPGAEESFEDRLRLALQYFMRG
ncbi:MAG TPA: Holliday junction branch migration protein RuvA [Candidatus Limnocylindrales bacterium]|nr:Holliday junction branch migration protein RuvA [Candidatus Limnocylindrales bacterium]